MSDLFTFVEPGGGGGPEAGMVMSIEAADLLALTGVGVRADSFVYELLDVHHTLIGPLKVSASQVPRVENNTSRSVFRTCSGLTVLDGDQGDDGTYLRLADIDPLRSRLRVTMVLQNGERFPLGVFMFGADTRKPFSWGTEWTPELFDETFVVDDPLDKTYGLAPGDSILTLVNQLVAQAGLPDVDFSGVVDAHASSAVTYAAGSSRNQALVALVALLGCYPPYFSNIGTYTTRAAPAPGQGSDFDYGSGGTVIDGSISTTSSLYRAPNRWQVIGSDPSGAFIGIYDLPADAANSYAKTGDYVVSSATMQGIPSVQVANLAAYINALTDRSNYVQASFSSTADPRHDTFDLVTLLGVQLQEISWSIECRSGGVMQHSLVGFYEAV